MNGALCTVHLVTVSVLVLSVPSSPDAPDFRNVTSASVTLVWDEPAEPNGVLLYYVIYQNGTEIKRVTGNVTKYVAVGLQPFTVYVFKLSVCTAVGCSNSSDSVPMRTLESGECVAKSSMCYLFSFFFFARICFPFNKLRFRSCLKRNRFTPKVANFVSYDVRNVRTNWNLKSYQN